MDPDMGARLIEYRDATTQHMHAIIWDRDQARAISGALRTKVYLPEHVMTLMALHGYPDVDFEGAGPKGVYKNKFLRIAKKRGLVGMDLEDMKQRRNKFSRHLLGRLAGVVYSETEVVAFLAGLSKEVLLDYSKQRYDDAVRELGYDW